MTISHLRSCCECASHIVTIDGATEHVRCGKCQSKRPTFGEWLKTVEKGSLVYVQPTVAGMLSRSKWLVADRDGDEVTIHVLGMPQTRTVTTVHQLAMEDVTPRPRYAL